MVGANTPASDLLDFLQKHQPDLLALSAALSKNVPAMQTTIAQVRTVFPDLPVLIGGQALSRVDAGELLVDNRVMYMPDCFRRLGTLFTPIRLYSNSWLVNIRRIVLSIRVLKRCSV